ncbi:MAG: amino acid ABC transporter permease [Hyphomicrobiaceae bacterium]|nr:amino acid ABC transporter permease [Hyphomicrobiaceae bacterium]
MAQAETFQDGPRRGGSLLYSTAFRGVAYQILLAAGVILVGYFLYSNVNQNLERQSIATGFRFLTESAGFDIGESLIPYDSNDSYGKALVVGILNTLLVSVFGVVLATILGGFMGIARVSRNWLAAKLASMYVEVMRNIPVVLHVIFWAAVFRNLPGPKESIHPFEGLYFNNRGLIFAVPKANPAYVWVGVAFLVGLVAAFLFVRWADRRRERTGKFMPTFWPALAIMIGLPLVTWLVQGAPLVWDKPTFGAFNFSGGAVLTPEFIALLVGIVVYTGAFIAEIVRAGIQSVPRGQIEAARSLGLRSGFVMRYVTLPQALRVIVPPTTSQYLSLAKNSSLGVFIGYPELVNVANTTLNQTGQAVEAVGIMMTVYLLMSLTISIIMNLYNRKTIIRER